MSEPRIRYDIVIEPLGDRPEIIIDWGNMPGWADTYRAELDGAGAIALIPKDDEQMPIIRTSLTGDRRWVMFSRVAGRIAGGQNTGGLLRIYCIGWQRTVRGENVKALTWVYPGGVIESADEPTMLDIFLALAEEGKQGG